MTTEKGQPEGIQEEVTSNTPEKAPEKPSKRVGRPRKAEVQGKKTGSRGAVGRPKGDAAIMNEYKARMLASPKSRKVLDKVFSAALDDEHKHQAVAWKLIVDRIAPASIFEAEAGLARGANGIHISISGVPNVKIQEGPEEVTPIEADYEEVPHEDG